MRPRGSACKSFERGRMYAYIRYADKQTSILPISLIQRFEPKHLEDFDPKKSKLAFWQGPDGGDGGYYDAKVIMLGGE